MNHGIQKASAIEEHQAYIALRVAMESYAPLGDEAWVAFKAITKFRWLPKKASLYRMGEIPQSFAYV